MLIFLKLKSKIKIDKCHFILLNCMSKTVGLVLFCFVCFCYCDYSDWYTTFFLMDYPMISQYYTSITLMYHNFITSYSSYVSFSFVQNTIESTPMSYVSFGIIEDSFPPYPGYRSFTIFHFTFSRIGSHLTSYYDVSSCSLLIPSFLISSIILCFL